MSKYAPLKHFLESQSGSRAVLSFDQVERVLGFALPPSARKHQPWWANTGGSHVHAAAWLDAGWRTSQVEMANERLVFVREGATTTPMAAPARSGVEESSAPFILDKSALTPAAVRLLEDYAEELNTDVGSAAISFINAAALERRRRLVEELGRHAPLVAGDSTELVREDRDAR